MKLILPGATYYSPDEVPSADVIRVTANTAFSAPWIAPKLPFTPTQLKEMNKNGECLDLLRETKQTCIRVRLEDENDTHLPASWEEVLHQLVDQVYESAYEKYWMVEPTKGMPNTLISALLTENTVRVLRKWRPDDEPLVVLEIALDFIKDHLPTEMRNLFPLREHLSIKVRAYTVHHLREHYRKFNKSQPYASIDTYVGCFTKFEQGTRYLDDKRKQASMIARR